MTKFAELSYFSATLSLFHKNLLQLKLYGNYSPQSFSSLLISKRREMKKFAELTGSMKSTISTFERLRYEP